MMDSRGGFAFIFLRTYWFCGPCTYFHIASVTSSIKPVFSNCAVKFNDS